MNNTEIATPDSHREHYITLAKTFSRESEVGANVVISKLKEVRNEK